MDFGRDSSEATTVRDYLSVVRRRKWIILQALVLVPAAAVFFSLQQERLYQATAEVLIGRQNLAASLNGTDPSPSRAAELATLYANEFKTYRREIDTASLERARTEVSKRIAQLDKHAKANSALY